MALPFRKNWLVPFRGIVDVICPNLCPVCLDIRLEDEEWICEDCRRLLEKIPPCMADGNPAEAIFIQQPTVERVAAFYRMKNGSVLHKLIHLMKYRERPDIGYFFGKEAAWTLLHSDLLDDIDVIIPVPLHPRRERQRGYNQSEWIAMGLSSVTGIPIDTDHLIRVKNNRQQALQSGKDRETNVSGIFKVLYPEELFRKRILLVDDVITTGATTLACIDALGSCWGSRINVFAVAKAVGVDPAFGG